MTTATNLIHSKTSRDRLTPRREPYWARIRAGLYVGFRRTETGGHWLGRLRGEDGRQRFVALGPDLPDFDTAAVRVIEWAARPVSEEQAQQPPEAMTIRKACALYVEHQRLQKSEKAAKDSAARFRYMIDAQPIGAVALVDLKAQHILDWVRKQVLRKEGEALRAAKDSSNRQLSSLKAALNFAYRMGMIDTDAAWRAVTPFRAVGRRRQGFVPASDRERLLAVSAHDIRAFVTALLLTGARPGEIAGVRACDFDREQGTLALDGKTGPRVIVLSSAALSFVRGRAEFKIGNALLFTTTGGAKWRKETWGNAFDKAVAAAGLSDSLVLYSIRHTAISEMIAGGMDAFVVARMAGTSTAMIDKHYGWLRADKTREALDRINLLSAAQS
ncbi:tyrosine-type recombinase/integrase [Caballeronia sp. LZ035]|uniref:tyrosine-type recombinase/integrase n=1 Tax=Caballeronia sp. LZ035 TaxID=3038568 RepID=UPI002867301B|nr:tyrosine-type recombinase/integrase [Caballeronia sp. LZ035]MDR5757666.1 tyrosine-type recombinase/integrase [Caballeronia sp. LZ035]